MATQTFSETTERIQEAFKESSQLFRKTTASLMEGYTRQMSTGYDVYKKFTDASPNDGKLIWIDMLKEGVASYQKANNHTLNLFKETIEKTFSVFTGKEWSPFSRKSADAILNIFNMQAEQSRKFGAQFLDALENEEVISAETLNKYSVRFSELMHESMKGSESSIKELIASFNEQASYSQETTKKLMTNIQEQMDSFTKTHVKFIEELMNTLNEKETSALEKQTNKQATSKKATNSQKLVGENKRSKK